MTGPITNCHDFRFFPTSQEKAGLMRSALHLLIQLGWNYLTPEQVDRLRGERTHPVILTPLLTDYMRAHCRVHYKGERHPFTENAIQAAVQELKGLPPVPHNTSRPMTCFVWAPACRKPSMAIPKASPSVLSIGKTRPATCIIAQPGSGFRAMDTAIAGQPISFCLSMAYRWW
jgi:hypothetical protein